MIHHKHQSAESSSVFFSAKGRKVLGGLGKKKKDNKNLYPDKNNFG